ncbi:MAG: hypothetical protein ABSC94_02460 [Polyangiaceae bacterium]
MAPSFREWLTGSYWRLDAPTEERAMNVDLEGRAADLLSALRDRTWSLSGTIDAERLASARPVAGFLYNRLLDERRIPYRFAFSGDDGRRYELSGQKEWNAMAPFESVTLLAASIYDDAGEEVARATLRFDLRADWLRWLRACGLFG